MTAYCKKCKKFSHFKLAAMGYRCVVCKEMEYDSYLENEEICKRKYKKYESRVKEMD